MRTIDEKEYCHERLGDAFEKGTSTYDTRRRVETLVDSFLDDAMVDGCRTLEVGCGLGFFSERLVERGADLLATDLGPKLVEVTRERAECRCEVADALRLVEQYGTEQFDLVLSSECIEHTPRPNEALAQMAAVLRPGGRLIVSTPNVLWYPVVRAATLLKLRPFDGYENFSSWRSIRRTLRDADVDIEREHGLHLFPFQLPLHGLSRWCDDHLQFARGLMINICVLGRKSPRPEPGR